MKRRQAKQFVQLFVDLGTQETESRMQKPQFLGGRGENYAQLLLTAAQSVPKARSLLLLANGPLVGTGFPGASRVNALTGGIGSGSAGGAFATKMRGAGYEQIIIEGSAANPTYLVIKDGKVALKDARPIWGWTVDKADAWLREQEGENISTALIGPAGETCGAAAAIIFDTEKAVGRCDLGSVMGRKHLKAIVVIGDKHLQPADPAMFRKLCENVHHRIAESGQKYVSRYGTNYVSPAAFEPVRNFQSGILSSDQRKALHYESFLPYFVEKYGCPGCPVNCGRRYYISTDQLAGMGSTGLHANTITDFGARLGVFNPEGIIAAHGLCNQYGLDIDNTSGVIAWAMEAFQRGDLTLGDTGGLDLSWGNIESLLKLIPMIAQRQGIGELLAQGCQKAAEQIGKESDRYCITVKGQELEEILRPYKGWALGIVVSERGGTHTRGAPVSELGGEIPAEIAQRAGLPRKALAAEAYEGKPEVVVYYERFHAILDSLGVCYMISDWSDPKLPSFSEFAQVLSAAIGEKTTAEQLSILGERIHTLGKLINITYAGFNRDYDYPPQRLMIEELENGEALPRDRWDQMLDRYYALHGWDLQTGRPTARTLEELKLSNFEWAIQENRSHSSERKLAQ